MKTVGGLREKNWEKNIETMKMMTNDDRSCAAVNEHADPGRREKQKKELFRNQKQTLDLFLERGAISQAQYDKSLGDLILKMGIDPEE